MALAGTDRSFYPRPALPTTRVPLRYGARPAGWVDGTQPFVTPWDVQDHSTGGADMRITTVGIVLGLLGAWLLTGCGNDAGPSDAGPGTPAGTSADSPGVSEADSLPIRLQFSLEVDGAIKSGRLPANTDREQLVVDTVAVIRSRIREFGVTSFEVKPDGESMFVVRLPADEKARVESVTSLVTHLGSLWFRVQVLPEQNKHDDRKRESAWPGTPAEFASWKDGEFERYNKQIGEGGAYAPSDWEEWGRPRFFLVKREGQTGRAVEHFEVCEIPKEGFRFDGQILTNARVSRDMANRPAVVFDVKPAYQNAFGEWTENNIGLPMAMLLNGEFTGERAPTIQSKLTDSVQISLGDLSYVEGEKRAKEIATVLQSGALKLRPKLESVAGDR